MTADEDLKEGGELLRPVVRPYQHKCTIQDEDEESDEFDDLLSFNVPSEYLNKSTGGAKQNEPSQNYQNQLITDPRVDRNRADSQDLGASPIEAGNVSDQGAQGYRILHLRPTIPPARRISIKSTQNASSGGASRSNHGNFERIQPKALKAAQDKTLPTLEENVLDS